MFEMLSQLKGTPRTCTLFFLPLMTLAFPLGVLLVVLQRLPAEEVQLAATDTRLLSPVSTFWCAAQEVTSGHPFYAYKVPRTPPILKDPPHLHTLAFRFNLLKGKHSLLRYHLLAGSTLELAGCTSQWSAPFDVFFGLEDLNSCLRPVSSSVVKPHLGRLADSSSEETEDDSTSEEEEEVDLQDESQGLQYQNHLVSGQSSKADCGSSLLSGHLDTSTTDDEPSPTCPGSVFPFRLNATRTGKYYVLVHTDDQTDPGGVLLHLRLNRTTYELPESVLLCRSPSACAIPLTFGAEERVVVFVSAEPDAGSALFPVRSKCQPRAAFYLLVFLLLPLLFSLALLYVLRARRKHLRAVRAAALRLAQETATSRSEEENPTTVKDEAGMSFLPSYRDVMTARNSVSPPPYEDFIRQPLVSVHRS